MARHLPVLVAVVVAMPALADDVGVTPARLAEIADGGYALEADVPPALVATLGAPVLPDRFDPPGRPSHRRVGVVLVVRWEFGGDGHVLEPGDVILLPWARSAVLLTARWKDGAIHRALLPRGTAGIRVPVDALRPVERTAIEVARRHVDAGLDRPVSPWLRFLLILALVAAAQGPRRATGLALIFAGGHAVAMVAVDVGVPAIPLGLTVAMLGVGAALLARAALRGRVEGLGPLVLAAGIVDGIGMAGVVGPETRAVVPALFGAAATVNVLQIVAAGGLSFAFSRRPVRITNLATAVGCLAMAFSVGATLSPPRGEGGASADPMAQLAAGRFDFTSGASVGTTGTVRRASAPRRLEDPAMVFLSVEPMEVRVEVLLRLRDFLEPLRIEGGPGSAIPIAVQSEIAVRAREMLDDALGVFIDGLEAASMLTRTDFVTVATTGVATRVESAPEPLDDAILGVTLIYGTQRSPTEIDLHWPASLTADAGIPAVWADPTGSERLVLTSVDPVLRWRNDLSRFTAPSVEAVLVNPPRLPVASLALVAVAALLGLAVRRARAAVVTTLVGAALLYPFVRTPVVFAGGWAPSRAHLSETTDELLTNVYRSFDQREEEAVYDRLAVSVAGEELSEIYLESRRALELENRGGTRARVDEVEVLEIRSVRRERDGFRVRTAWTVSGSVNHFGHVHFRRNRYDATLHLVAVDGVWKIRGIELHDERRVL